MKCCYCFTVFFQFLFFVSVPPTILEFYIHYSLMVVFPLSFVGPLLFCLFPVHLYCQPASLLIVDVYCSNFFFFCYSLSFFFSIFGFNAVEKLFWGVFLFSTSSSSAASSNLHPFSLNFLIDWSFAEFFGMQRFFVSVFGWELLMCWHSCC